MRNTSLKCLDVYICSIIITTDSTRYSEMSKLVHTYTFYWNVCTYAYIYTSIHVINFVYERKEGILCFPKPHYVRTHASLKAASLSVFGNSCTLKHS